MSAGAAVLQQIDEFRSENTPSDVPLLRAMGSGELSRDDLRAFAAQYFHLVDSLPRFVSTVHSVTTKHPAIRRSLLELLVALELKPPSIADLWLQTCAALGLFSDSVREGEPSTPTAVCLADFEYLCQAGSAQGLAALYAWITRLPKSCRLMQAALEANYDLAGSPGIRFFEVVSLRAETHARALRSSLVTLLDEYPEAGPSALEAAYGATSAVMGMYAGALNAAPAAAR